jgi:bacillithiol system protein YtxJ
MNWLVVSGEDQLKAILNSSFEPEVACVIIFKHSPRCSISVVAKDRLERKWQLSDKIYPVYYIDVLSQRGLSQLVASEYDVVHESPQILLIRNGKCVYSASHTEIAYDQIQAFFNN